MIEMKNSTTSRRLANIYTLAACAHWQWEFQLVSTSLGACAHHTAV